MGNNEQTAVREPAFRKLRAYAFDPSLSLEIDTAEINSLTYKVKWENLEPGPSGEYVEVIDFDPTIKKFFAPVNLNDPYILAQDGLDPSESNPQFHQQMVYAVVMTTIKNFEKALGRRILWAPRLLENEEQYETHVKGSRNGQRNQEHEYSGDDQNREVDFRRERREECSFFCDLRCEWGGDSLAKFGAVCASEVECLAHQAVRQRATGNRRDGSHVGVGLRIDEIHQRAENEERCAMPAAGQGDCKTFDSGNLRIAHGG